MFRVSDLSVEMRPSLSVKWKGIIAVVRDAGGILHGFKIGRTGRTAIPLTLAFIACTFNGNDLIESPPVDFIRFFYVTGRVGL